MKQQNVDPHLAELAANYAKAAQAALGCEMDSTDGFQFTADGYLIQVCHVENHSGAEPPNDWYEWRIKKDGATVAENADDDRAIFSVSAVEEAWLQFSRLTPANEDWESDSEAAALYRAARDAVRAA